MNVPERKRVDERLIEEDGPCPVDGCDGIIVLPPVENCSCHLGYPPCSQCTGNRLQCNRCGFEEEEA